jgi:hypothetical protein
VMRKTAAASMGPMALRGSAEVMTRAGAHVMDSFVPVKLL